MSRLWDTFHAWRGHPWLGLAVRIYLGWLFVSASWHKILEPASFALDIATYQFLPLAFLHPFALVLPWIELFAGALLIVGWRVRASGTLIALMMVSFIIALAWALHLELDMACGCFASQGAEEDPISWRTVLRDLGWLSLAAYVVWFDTDPWGVERFFRRQQGVTT